MTLPLCHCRITYVERKNADRSITGLPPYDWAAYGLHHWTDCPLTCGSHWEERARIAEAKLAELGVLR